MINEELKKEIRDTVRQILDEDPDGVIERKVELAIYGSECRE